MLRSSRKDHLFDSLANPAANYGECARSWIHETGVSIQETEERLRAKDFLLTGGC